MEHSPTNYTATIYDLNPRFYTKIPHGLPTKLTSASKFFEAEDVPLNDKRKACTLYKEYMALLKKCGQEPYLINLLYEDFINRVHKTTWKNVRSKTHIQCVLKVATKHYKENSVSTK